MELCVDLGVDESSEASSRTHRPVENGVDRKPDQVILFVVGRLGDDLVEQRQHDQVVANLWFACWIVVVRRLGWHLLKHLMETHEDFGVVLDQLLELLDDGLESFCLAAGVFDQCDLLRYPRFEDALVPRKPSANSMVNEDRHAVDTGGAFCEYEC